MYGRLDGGQRWFNRWACKYGRSGKKLLIQEKIASTAWKANCNVSHYTSLDRYQICRFKVEKIRRNDCIDQTPITPNPNHSLMEDIIAPLYELCGTSGFCELIDIRPD